MIIDCVNQSAIIGTIGTLLGVIVGFILNLVIRIGKIKVFVNSISPYLYNLDENGDPVETDTIDYNIGNVVVNLNLDFYNTSSFEQKIGRDFYLIFRTTKGNIKKEITDKTYTRFRNINLKPNELVNCDLHLCLSKDLEIYHDFDFYLEYKNNKDRTIKIKRPFTCWRGFITHSSSPRL